MLGNSLIGAHALLGEPVTLRYVTAASYLIASGTVTSTTTDYPALTARVRQIRAADRMRLGATLVAEATELIVLNAVAVPEGIVPRARDRFISADGLTTWEVLSVTTSRVGGMPVTYECQVAGR